MIINPADPASPKIGLKIESPRDQKISSFFNILLILSFLFIAGTLCMLALEYFHLPVPAWLLDFMDELSLIFS